LNLQPNIKKVSLPKRKFDAAQLLVKRLTAVLKRRFVDLANVQHDGYKNYLTFGSSNNKPKIVPTLKLFGKGIHSSVEIVKQTA
jgi:hypothetical protein